MLGTMQLRQNTPFPASGTAFHCRRDHLLSMHQLQADSAREVLTTSHAKLHSLIYKNRP